MVTTTRYVSVWLDETSNPTDPRWIVDRCTETTTDTLRTFDDEDAAWDYARATADREDLYAVAISSDGRAERI